MTTLFTAEEARVRAQGYHSEFLAQEWEFLVERITAAVDLKDSQVVVQGEISISAAQKLSALGYVVTGYRTQSLRRFATDFYPKAEIHIDWSGNVEAP